MNIGDLTSADLGRTVTVTHQGTRVTGPLSFVHHDQDWETMTALCEPENVRVPGRKFTQLSIGEWEARDLPATAPCTIASGAEKVNGL